MDPISVGPAEKPGTVLFLPGTGRTNPRLAGQLADRISAVPGLSGYRVQTVDWADGAPEGINPVPALPERYSAEDPPAVADAALALALFGTDLSTADPLRQAASAGAPAAAPDAALLGETLQNLVLGVLTDAAVRYRIRLTAAAGEFFAKIAFYLRRGPEARAAVAEALAGVDQGAPVVLMGHSLGSVAAVDLLSSPGGGRGRVDLLVTVGSPAPWFYLLDALAHIGPGRPGNGPEAAWLNIRDKRDLLSFCAERVFAGRNSNISDVGLESGEPFPAAHTAYFSDPLLYRILWEHLQRALGGDSGSGNGARV